MATEPLPLAVVLVEALCDLATRLDRERPTAPRDAAEADAAEAPAWAERVRRGEGAA